MQIRSQPNAVRHFKSVWQKKKLYLRLEESEEETYPRRVPCKQAPEHFDVAQCIAKSGVTNEYSMNPCNLYSNILLYKLGANFCI